MTLSLPVGYQNRLVEAFPESNCPTPPLFTPDIYGADFVVPDENAILAEDHLQGREWSRIGQSELEVVWDTFAQMLPEAFSYYIAAILSLDGNLSSESELAIDSIMRMLFQDEDPSVREWCEARWRALSEKQAKVVREWLLILREQNVDFLDQEELDQALESLSLLQENGAFSE